MFFLRFVVQTTEGKTSVGSKISLSDGRQMFAKWGIRKHNKYLDVRHPQRCNDMHKMDNCNSTISCYPPPPPTLQYIYISAADFYITKQLKAVEKKIPKEKVKNGRGIYARRLFPFMYKSITNDTRDDERTIFF